MADNFKVTINPAELRAGQTVTIEVETAADLGQVERVVATVPDYDIAEVVPRIGDNLYRLNYQVPWEAWPGNYRVKVYARGVQGNQPATTFLDVKVVP
ncbi:MAG TPA: hypothetical protein GXZ82_14285 [Firmicutes bacterium]|jgi:hypothetical protein|nr:hypothetical protein [Bacillota bacterium]